MTIALSIAAPRSRISLIAPPPAAVGAHKEQESGMSPIPLVTAPLVTAPQPVYDRPRGWIAPVAASLALHAAVAGATMIDWSFRKPLSEAAPPASMVVELAVMPASAPVPPSEVPPGPEQVQAAPKPVPADPVKIDPPPLVDAALKPDFALPVTKRDAPTKTVVAAETARDTTAPPTVEAPKQVKSEAPVEGSSAAPPTDAEQAWEGQLLARLQRNKRYPVEARQARQQDTVFVRLVMDRRGRLLDAALKRSGGYAALDGETLALAKRSSPFPAPPDSVAGDRIVRVVPVEFYISKRR